MIGTDKKLLKINLTDDEISSIRDAKYKEMTKKAISDETWNLKQSHSKMDELSFSDLKIKNYVNQLMKWPMMKNAHCSSFKLWILSWKTTTETKIKSNNANYVNQGKWLSIPFIEVKYKNIFEDIESQVNAVRLLTDILEVREQLFENEKLMTIASLLTAQ